MPLGGGGLLAGAALATRALSPGCRLYGVEPEAGDDGLRSLRQGTIVRIDTPRTIADGAQTQQLGVHTFAIIRHAVDDVFTVSDAELVDSVFLLASRMKIVAEPTGCLGLAALRRHAPQFSAQRVGVIISGGNADLAALVARP
ncbi:pyridoxal-phosphate dependent enzyme [Streptosporangium album]|uniref:pyridoxal-phosphate dependent enzyme n=1 Tax=Streptosporangium album TaxID=47479 RepID=UPI0031E6C827